MKATKDRLNKKDIKKIFNSPSCKKWAKNMEKMYEEEYRINILDFLLAECHKEMVAKPTATTTKCKHYSRKEELKQLEQFFRKMPNMAPLRVSDKKKEKKR